MSANLAHLLVRAGRVHGARPALARGAAVLYDYATLARRAFSLGSALRSRFGLQPGDRVALVLSNDPRYVEMLFACWYAGLAAVPINAKLHARELAYVLEHCGARLLFTTAELAPGAADAPAVVIESGSAEYERLTTGDPLLALHPISGDSPAWLFYTSGTTGRPKGVTLTHRNLMIMTMGYFSDVDAIQPGDSILHAAPMSHGSGLYILPHVAQGALHIVADSGGFDAEEIYALLPQVRGVTMFAAPTMVKRLVDTPAEADTSNLKTIVYGGGPMYVVDCQAALRRFGIKLVQIFGQGESPMTITVLPRALHADVNHPRYLERLGSVGVAHSAVEVMVADADDRPLPAGVAGEVLVRGDCVMSGYWNNEVATAETLRNGWLHTGDIGSLDEDGFLTLRDRSKDLIISGGSNIYPREIEEVLLTADGVAEVAVIGRPHREWGEEVVAFVVVRAGRALDTAKLDAWCLRHIARFKRPREYRMVDALPKNATGKVLKTELRKQLDGESSG